MHLVSLVLTAADSHRWVHTNARPRHQLSHSAPSHYTQTTCASQHLSRYIKMCYVVCSASRASVNTLPNLPPPPMSAQSKKEKRRFRKSLKAVVDKIMCRGKPKVSCSCLSVVEEKEKEESGDVVRVDVDVDVITDAPSIVDTSFGDVQPVLTEASVPKLPDLGIGLEPAPELVAQPGPSSFVGEAQFESSPAQEHLPSVDSSHVAPTSAPRRRALGGSARDEVALARRGPDRVSKKPSRDQTTGCTETKLARVPLADVTNRDAKIDSQAGNIARAAFEETNTPILAPSHVVDLVIPDASTPCTPVPNDVASEVVSAPLADCKRIDEESALFQPATGVKLLQDQANFETPAAARAPELALDLHQTHAATNLSVVSENPVTPVLPSLVRRVDVTPVSGASIGSLGTPDLFFP